MRRWQAAGLTWTAEANSMLGDAPIPLQMLQIFLSIRSSSLDMEESLMIGPIIEDTTQMSDCRQTDHKMLHLGSTFRTISLTTRGLHPHRGFHAQARQIRPLSAHVRPDTNRASQATDGPSRREGRHLCQARRLQLGSRLRWQQAPQARVHRARRDRFKRRYAGLDWWRAVEPYADGSRHRGQDRHEMRRRAGELGPSRGCRL